MSREALYEATRGHWKIGPRRKCAELAMAVVGGTIREVSGKIAVKVINHYSDEILKVYEV